MLVVKMHEAKTQLSRLVKEVQGGPITASEAHHAAAYDLLDTFRNIWGRV